MLLLWPSATMTSNDFGEKEMAFYSSFSTLELLEKAYLQTNWGPFSQHFVFLVTYEWTQ